MKVPVEDGEVETQVDFDCYIASVGAASAPDGEQIGYIVVCRRDEKAGVSTLIVCMPVDADQCDRIARSLAAIAYEIRHGSSPGPMG